MHPKGLSAYDEAVLAELLVWRSPKGTRRGRVADRVERSLSFVTGLVPLKLIETALSWVLPRLRDLTWRATSKEMVIRAYRRAGTPVSSIEEIAGLELEIVDGVAGDKRIHEATVAGIEGGATGFFGGLTLAADIAGVMILSLRAVQSRALVYGFDPADDDELAFVLQVLDAASQLGPQSKGTARQGISLLGRQLAKHGIVMAAVERAIERLPRQLVTRFAAMKSESAVPFVGAVTSASFNAWYLQAVTRTAQMAYRERFLRRTYGDDLMGAYGL